MLSHDLRISGYCPLCRERPISLRRYSNEVSSCSIHGKNRRGATARMSSNGWNLGESTQRVDRGWYRRRRRSIGGCPETRQDLVVGWFAMTQSYHANCPLVFQWGAAARSSGSTYATGQNYLASSSLNQLRSKHVAELNWVSAQRASCCFKSSIVNHNFPLAGNFLI